MSGLGDLLLNETTFSGDSTPTPGPSSSSAPQDIITEGEGDVLGISSQPVPPGPSLLASPVFPVAAVLVIVFVAFLLTIIITLIIRKCLVHRGVQMPCDCKGSSAMTCTGGETSCYEREGCRELLETMDCTTPDCRVWLDNVCPTKQQCAVSCAMLCSCFCCHAVADACQDVQLCPDCSALQCPEMECCDGCQFKIAIPECDHVSCLCFECGRPARGGAPRTNLA